jgi:anti-sigma B factor antagonist
MARDRAGRRDAGPAHGHHAAVEIGRLTGLEATRGSGPDESLTAARAPAPDLPGLEIDVRGDAPVTVRLTGDLDLHTAPALGERLGDLTEADVVVECEGLRFVDSIGVTQLVRMHQEFRARGASLALRGITGVPQRTLEILGLTETLDIDIREP